MAQAPARTRDQSGAAPVARPLAGRHALVTGGNRGIGAAVAERLAALGAGVTLVARDAATLQGKAAEIAAAHGVPAGFAVADVTDENAAADAFETATAAGGPVDILVNNAGSGKSAPFKRTDLAFWRAMIDVNLTSTFLFTHAALPAMVEAGYGRIINVASTAGLVGYRYVVAYCAAKHGVIGLTRSLALETAKTGVTVNAVCPGYVDTDMTRKTIANIMEKTGASEEEAIAQITAGNPQGRLIAPEEVASAVAWLALPEQAAVTGQAIPVAGGEVM
jgi:NAD(P)-dependent dehydrogenase (short-subunit alcohol dehydrogenase family)